MKIAVWGHPASELEPGADSIDHVRDWLGRLREAGVSMYFPFVLSGGKSFFECEALGPAERDLLGPIMQVAGELRMAVHPILGLGGIVGAGGHVYQKPFEKTEVPGWAAKWPCPSWGENHAVTVRAADQMIETYSPQGIHLDYARYPNSSLLSENPCACERCQAMRLRWLGKAVPEPRDMAISGYNFKELGWRGQFVRAFVESMRGVTDSHGIQLSAAVRARYYEDALVEGQDWAEWCEDGLLDIVCPMSYNPCFGRFARFIGNHRRLAGDTRAQWFAGIGRRSSLGVIDAEMMRRQIEFAVSAGAEGVSIFHARALEDEDLRVLGEISRRD